MSRKDRAEARGIELDRVAGLLLDGRLLAAADVLASLDAVVFAALHPLHHLGNAPDGVWMGGVDLVEESAHPVLRDRPNPRIRAPASGRRRG